MASDFKRKEGSEKIIRVNNQETPASFRHLTDVISTEERSFQLRRHSNLNSFKVSPGTKIMTVERSGVNSYEIDVKTGVFSTHGVGYKELFAIKASKRKFFERVWENAGRVVKLNVLKAGDGDRLKKLDMTIGDSAPDKIYKWGIPEYWIDG